MSYVSAGATISSCGRYRYRLWREWWLQPIGAGPQLGAKTCIFVMLNPSTADAEQDDPTIRKCVGFARAWGYERLEVVNLFAHRATDPRELLALGHGDDPVGSRNHEHVRHALEGVPFGRLVCAWGAHGAHLGQDQTMLGWLGDLPRVSLGVTADGHPRHPLYVPYSAEPRPFSR